MVDQQLERHVVYRLATNPLALGRCDRSIIDYSHVPHKAMMVPVMGTRNHRPVMKRSRRAQDDKEPPLQMKKTKYDTTQDFAVDDERVEFF